MTDPTIPVNPPESTPAATAEMPPTVARWTRRLAIALAISVAINLFLGGFLAARALSGPRWRGDGRGPAGLFLGSRGLLGGRAGPEARREVERVMQRHGPHLRESRRGLRETHRAVRDALANEPFDRAALEAALAALREQTGRSQAAMHGAMVDLAERLPPDQRHKLGRRIRRGLR